LKLHGYQELARDFLRQHREAGLFQDMGYGKTAITLSALEPRHLPALVTAPKRVVEEVWPVEHELWRPDLSMALAVGEPHQRRAAIDHGADITVISRDNLKDAPPRYRTVVFDELSGYKDRGTNRWKIARKLALAAQNSWGLTGTPTPNGLLDLWAQIYLLDGGVRLDTSVVRYRNRYFFEGARLQNGTVIEYIPKPEAQQRIFEKIQDICLSMEGEVDLPPVTHNSVEVPISNTLRGAYREFARELALNMELLGYGIYTAANAAVLTSKLSQLTAGFLFSDAGDGSYTWLHDGKMNGLREIAEGTGDNLFVFYRFIPERDRILELFPQAKHIDEYNAIKDWNAGKVPMLVAHPAAAGHGLNLQYGGHTIVWMTVPWSLEEWLQGNGRVARQGQTHPVMVHRIEVPRTIDRRIYDDKVAKTFDQDALLDHVRSPM
jgi:SNF2 family DNA or RNA helicase